MNTTPRYGSLEQLGHGEPLDSVHANRMRWEGWGAGQTALVTGANAGLGYFTSLALAASGAHVIMACRSSERADRARLQIEQRVPDAKITTRLLDTSDYSSVDRLAEQLEPVDLDIIIANAGIIHTPTSRQENAAGHELVMATNYLGHVRLVGKLAPQFKARPLRFIGLGSMATRILPAQPQNLMLHHGYGAYRSYTQSKAALQSFTLGLDHRLKLLSWPARSIAVHPGYSVSGLTVQVPGVNDPGFGKRFVGQLQRGFAQGKHHGVVPIVEAALNPGISSTARGIYLGPQWLSTGQTRMVKPANLTRRKKLLDPVWEMFTEANDGLDPFEL
ncbi:SDR family NAD(P)-dependent oxidoreductase [Glutamicibacter sp. MNS18]|uniref:SDR family NAD(P)-dependent oxidoreductase n=1 Tax=Glutamicibacter sp. MNS18 TaxID=2989817 RepID=UPI0022360CF0|nr:SDR family NAD(P)-dependent oxidoreductase [Glutamicibacter sp. MNS18]MCW4463931.1 SDR family NAD(P)-dependent oxidoreductase [Glutamicibacter sp. MNS18]